MGIERTFRPDHFRERAEEFRTKADNFEQGPSREALLRAAEEYDELARRAEKIRTVRELQQ